MLPGIRGYLKKAIGIDEVTQGLCVDKEKRATFNYFLSEFTILSGSILNKQDANLLI